MPREITEYYIPPPALSSAGGIEIFLHSARVHKLLVVHKRIYMPSAASGAKEENGEIEEEEGSKE